MVRYKQYAIAVVHYGDAENYLANGELLPVRNHQVNEEIMKKIKQFSAEINYEKDHWNTYCRYNIDLKKKVCKK